MVELWVYPAIVQGNQAVSSLCRSLKSAAKQPPDLLIIGRGGGSKEDLAAFQTEEVVRAIASFPSPVIAAIGHEIDTTLSDLAADLRAPTPSAAAEMATPDRLQIKNEVDSLIYLLYHQMMEGIRRKKMQLTALKERWRRAVSEEILFTSREHLNFLDWRLSQQMRRKLVDASARLAHKVALFTSASPLQTLQRGYAIACTSDNSRIFSTRQLQIGSTFSLRFQDGKILATVVENDNQLE